MTSPETIALVCTRLNSTVQTTWEKAPEAPRPGLALSLLRMPAIFIKQSTQEFFSLTLRNVSMSKELIIYCRTFQFQLRI